MTSREKRDLRCGLAFCALWFIGLGVFTVYPVVASLFYSFCDYSVLQAPVWIGLENYRRMAGDAVFWQSLRNTLFYAALSLPLGMIVSLTLAMLLNTEGARDDGVPHDFLPAVDHPGRRQFDAVAVDFQRPVRRAQLGAAADPRPLRPDAADVAGRPGLGQAGAGADEPVGRGQLDGDLPGRPAGRAEGTVRIRRN